MVRRILEWTIIDPIVLISVSGNVNLGLVGWQLDVDALLSRKVLIG